MTQKEIHKGNKLIAEFMKAKIGKGGTRQNPVYNGLIISPSGVTWTTELKSVMYRESWDWIMPVVRKIADMVLYKEWTNLNTVLKRWNPIIRELQNLNIEGLWSCVVNFINWYNLHNPSTPANDTGN